MVETPTPPPTPARPARGHALWVRVRAAEWEKAGDYATEAAAWRAAPAHTAVRGREHVALPAGEHPILPTRKASPGP
jgi:hypothetical protein